MLYMGYLTYKKAHLPWTLPYADAKGPKGVLEGQAFSYRRDIPVPRYSRARLNRLRVLRATKPVLRLHRLLHLRTSLGGILRNQAGRGEIDRS
jgi:hypothetical protein